MMLRIALLSIGVAFSSGALAQDVRVSLTAPPLLYTCQLDIPVPATAPPGIKPFLVNKIQAECGGGEASGKILVVEIGDANLRMPAGLSAVQTVTVDGARWLMNPATGACDRRVPFAIVITEYFVSPPGGGPARDHQATAECCESRYSEHVSVDTVLMPLPATARPPIPGFGAGLPYMTADQRVAIEAQIAANARARFGYEYEYDGCNSPRRTPSGTVHYLRYRLSYPGGPSGSTTFTQDR